MRGCCEVAGNQKVPIWIRGIREMLAWFLPGAVLVLIPKCPACLAAYVAVWSGIGISFSTAAWLRWGLVLISLVSLLFLIVNRFLRARAMLEGVRDLKDKRQGKS
jgi:hypothetical protein